MKACQSVIMQLAARDCCSVPAFYKLISQGVSVNLNPLHTNITPKVLKIRPKICDCRSIT